jgi:hypothetical protein
MPHSAVTQRRALDPGLDAFITRAHGSMTIVRFGENCAVM